MSTYAITTNRYQATETDAGDSFVDAVFVSLILVALPIKNLAYIVPPIFFVLQAFWGNDGFVRRTHLLGNADLLRVGVVDHDRFDDRSNGQSARAAVRRR